MRAELKKLRYLPAPRWTVSIAMAALLLALVISYFAGGESRSDYETAADIGCGLGSAIAAIVLGVWSVGVEYGQKTVRRVLVADPRRGRLLGAKAAMAVLATLGVTILSYGLAVPLFAAVASVNGASSPGSHILEAGAGALATLPVYALVGFGVTLLTRSMAGGLTTTLVLALVIDSALSAVPSVGHYSLGSATTDVSDAIAGSGDPDLLRGVLVSLAWALVVAGAGAVRFTRTDVR